MLLFIIINWFGGSGIWIWNRFRVIFKWKILRVKLNITIINGKMINSPHDSWNHRNDFWRRVHRFKVSYWRLDIPISWWISRFITKKGVELVHFSSKAWWEEVRSTDDSGISLLFSPSTSFSINLLSNINSCNKWPESSCIIVGGIWRTKMMRALTWSGQCSWVYNQF